MKRFFLLFALIAAFCILGFSQPGNTPASDASARVVWERYKLANRKVSLLLPKLPISIESDDRCNQLAKTSYYAYAEQAVYEFTIAAKNKQSIPEWCRDKHKFGRETFESRLSEIRGVKADSETEIDRGQSSVKVFKRQDVTRWVVDDLSANRWLELAIFRRPDTKVDEDRYIGSLSFSDEMGIEIGKGSPNMLGDKDFKIENVAKPGINTGEGLNIIAKPRPTYTDSARAANIQGTVRLRVIFLANGGIGSIAPVTGLPNGLTEQAISCAKRVVFLPKRVNGVPVTVVKQVEYSFSIY